jgi:hypothetical protein
MDKFEPFEYFKNKIQSVGITGIYRVNGIGSLEELLSQSSTLKSTIMLVKDGTDGVLSINSGNFDSSYHTIYIMKHVMPGSSDSRIKAKQLCKNLGKKIFMQMANDYEVIDNDTLRIDFSRISYNELGPIAQNFYGYSFSFTIDEDYYIE